MSQLEAMGFPTIRCQKALLATGNSDAEVAMTWLFEHMEDPGKLRHAGTADRKLIVRY
jgi:ubiquitin carboxyl-terminal hydrolase 5/13